MKEIKLSYSDDEFKMIQRVANRRKSSIRSLLLRMCYDLDYKQSKKEYEGQNSKYVKDREAKRKS